MPNTGRSGPASSPAAQPYDDPAAREASVRHLARVMRDHGMGLRAMDLSAPQMGPLDEEEIEGMRPYLVLDERYGRRR